MQFQQVSIIGVGLLGGSLGMAIKARSESCRVVGYGHRRSTLQRALEIGVIDEAAADLPAAVHEADLVVLATPVGLMRQMLQGIAPAVGSGSLVTDVGSTKRSIVTAAAEVLPEGVSFVGSHPMAGSEKRGVEFARADLFSGAMCILTPTARTDSEALSAIESFWQALDMRTTRLSPEDHDRLLADVSHLPHALAAALVAMQAEEGLALVGKGFLDTTRIAGGDGALWRDIFLDNRDNLKASLDRLRGKLDALAAMLNAQDAQQLAAWLDSAARRRETLLRQKLGEVTPD